ncbi:MAG: septum site-determining protein MinD, partial [Euryarchaeota archaeon]|nr:septum site-determining protein MinD [Euryarchaeota archaeon]
DIVGVSDGRAEVLGVVINRARGVDVDAVEEVLSLPVLAVLPEDARVAEALELETPLLVQDAECEFSREIVELAIFLLKYWEREDSS